MSESDRVLPLFPLEQVVLFPGMLLPLHIFEERYKVMIGSCQVTDQIFGVLLIRSGSEVGEPAQPMQVGCTARMVRVDRLPDGRMAILNIGEQRFRLLGEPRVTPEGYLVGDARLLGDLPPNPPAPDALVSGVSEEFRKYLAKAAALSSREGEKPTDLPELPTDPGQLSFWVASLLRVHPRERQQLLEVDDITHRLEQELNLLGRENRAAARTIGPFSVN